MSAQSAKKKRLGSRRRVANQNEMSKTDDSHLTDSSFVAQSHIPEENTESLNVLANFHNSQSETQHPPSPELSGNRRKLGSSRRHKETHVKDSVTESYQEPRDKVETDMHAIDYTFESVIQHVKDSVAKSDHGSTEDVVGNISNNETLETTERTLTIETAEQEISMETLLEGTDKFDTAQTEDVGDQVKESAQVGISNLNSSHLQSSSTENQQTIDQPNIREMPDEELPNVGSVTEKENKERDEDTEWLRQDGNLLDKYLVSQDTESSITPEITTEKHSSREHTEPECSVEQEILSSPKEELLTNEEQNEIFNLPKVTGDHHSEVAVNKPHEQDVEPTENQESSQLDDSSENEIHDATDISEIISGHLMNQTEVSDTFQSKLTVKDIDDSPTNQDNSNPDDKQDEHPAKENNFEASEQKHEDYHVYENKEPQISDTERVDTALGQVFEIEGRVEDDTKPSDEQTGHQEKEGLFSEMEESASSLQTLQSEIDVPFDSQPQQNDTSFHPIGNRRKLGSRRRNKGRQHVKDSVAESDHEPTEDVVGNISNNETLETTEMTLTIETAEQEISMETLLEGTDKFDTAQTEDVGDQVKESAQVGISNLSSSHLQSSSTENQQTIDQPNIREMPDEELPNVGSVTEKENKERDEDTEWLRQDGNLLDKYLVSQDTESSITPEITTEKHSSREHTEPECSVEQEILSSPKEELLTNEEQNEIFNLPKVTGDHHSEVAVNKPHEQDVEPTENQESSQLDDSSENEIHDATDISEIISGNLMNQTEVSDTFQSKLTVKDIDDSPTNQDNSNPDDKQDEHPAKENNFEASEQKHEDYHVYENKEPQISDTERVDTALGQVFEIEGRVEDDTKPSDEQTGHQEKEGLFSEMEESASSLQTLQSEIDVPFDSQPQQNDTSFHPIGHRRKLGSSRRNKGRQHVKDSVAESDHEPTEDVVGNISNNETLETTEMTLTIETAEQEISMETLLEGTDKFDTARTEDVGDQVKESAQVGISNLNSSHLQSSSTENQQTIDQPNIREMPDEELPNVGSVTEKENKERDEDTEWLRQDGNLLDKYLVSQDTESSITPEITTEKHSSREHTEPECSVEQEILSSPKEELLTNEEQNEIFNLPKVTGDHHSEVAVNKPHEQDVEPTENQESSQLDDSSENEIHDATDISEIISGHLMNQTEVSDTFQSKLTVKDIDDSPTNQDNSNPDDKQDEHPAKENNFEASEQKHEDYHVYENKEPQISDTERVDTALGQVFEIEGRVEDDTKPSDEQTGHQEKEGLFSEMEESASSLQTLQSEIDVPFDSQPQQNDTSFHPIGNRRKLGSRRRNKGRQHVKDSVAESDHEPTEDVVGNISNNETLETTEMTLTIETAEQEISMETLLEGTDKFDTAQTEDVGDQVKESAQVGISNLSSSHLQSSSTENQQTIDQPNIREMPDEELPNVGSVTEKENKERDEDTEWLRQDGNLLDKYLVSQDTESSITPEITTEKHSSREHTEPECSVEQEILSSPKEELLTNEEQNEIFNLPKVTGDHHSEVAVNKPHEQDVEPTENQESSQLDDSSENEIHDATDISEIISGNLMNQTEVSDTFQSKLTVKDIDDSPTNQDNSNPDDKQDEHPAKENNFEASEQKHEDYHVYENKEPQISDTERVDTALGQVFEIEGRVEDDTKPSDEQTGHQEKEGLFSEMEESASSLQTLQSEIDVPFDSQPQQNDTSFHPIGHRRKLGSSRRNKGRQHVKDSVAESDHEPTEDVVGNISNNETLETTEMTLTIETAEQEISMETLLEGTDKFDTARTEDVGDQVKESAQVGISNLNSSHLQSSSTENQQTIDQPNIREMPDEELPNVGSVTEKENKERDEDTEWLRQDGNLLDKYLVSQDTESSITPEITTEKHSSREHTEPECSVEQEILSSPKEELLTNEEQNEIFNLPKVTGDHHSEVAVNKPHEQDVEPTENQESSQLDDSSENEIHDATDISEIISGHLMNQTEVSDTFQSKLTVKDIDDSPTNQDNSNPDDKQDEHPAKENNFEASEQKHEDYHVYENKEPQISDTERVDTALGQVFEIEGRVEDDTKPSDEQTGHQEKEGLFSEMEESASSLQTLQSEIDVPFDSQPQQNDTSFHPIGHRRKLGSSRRNKGRQHVKDSVAESDHEPTEDVVGNISNNETLETTEMTLTIETAEQEISMETLLEGTDKFDTARTEDVGDQVKESAQVGISNLNSSHLQSSSTENQQTIDQPNIREMPDEELPNVGSVTEKENKERDEDTEWLRQDGNLLDKYLVSQDTESSITPEITTEKHSSREHTEPECSVEQEILSSPKEELLTNEEQNEIFNLPKVTGDHHSEVAVNKPHEQDVEPTENQESSQLDDSSENEIHDATDISEIISGNLMNQTEVSDTFQSKLTVKDIDDSPTNQDNSNPDDKQDEHPAKENNFEASEQKHEDYHVYENKEPQISDTERVDTALGQVFEIEGRVEDDTKPSDEQTGHQEKEGLFSEMEENASSLQTLQSELNVPIDSQPQQNDTDLNPIGHRRKLGSSRRNKGRKHVKDSVAESDYGHKEEDVERTRGNEALETVQMLLPIERTGHEELSKGSQYDIMPATHDSSLYSAIMPGCSSEVQSPTLKNYPEAVLESLIPKSENLQEDHDERENDFKVEVSDKSVEATLEGADKSDTLQSQEVRGDHHAGDALNTQHEQDVEPTEKQEMPQIDFSSESGSHDATENLENISGNPKDQTEVSDTDQSELIVKSSESQVENDIKPTVVQADYQEKEGLLSEMEESASSLQTLQSEINVPIDSQPQQNDTGLNPIGHRRKLGSSRRNKGRQHVKDSVAESDHEPTEDVVGNISNNETLETTEMTLTIETAEQEISMETLLEGTDKFDTAQTEDVIDQVKESPQVGISNLNSSHLQSSSTENQQTIDQPNIREMPDEELPNVGSVTEKENKERDEDTEWLRQDGNLPGHQEKEGLFSEREESASSLQTLQSEINVPIDSQPQQNDTGLNPIGHRRKLGSSRRNKGRQHVKDSVAESDHEPVVFVHVADVSDSKRNVDVSVGSSQIDDFSATVFAGRNTINPLPSVNTEDTINTGISGGGFVSSCETTQSTQNDEERPESVNIIQDQALKSTEALVLTDLEIVKSVVKRGAGEEHITARASKQEPDDANEGAHDKNLEIKNASSYLDSPSKRRKMGSTRRNLGTGTKQEDLHQKQNVNDDATETPTHAIDVKPESSSSIKKDELQLHMKHKDSGTETMEYSHTGESLKPLAHQTFEENPVSQGQLLETEPQLTPSDLPAIPSTSPKHDLLSESASGGRRRKLGSHRKSHGHQNSENQTARGDKITDTQNERDVRSIREEGAVKIEELRDECLGPDKIQKVDESHKKPSSNLSTSKEGEHSRPVSEKTAEPVTPVQHRYADSQQKLSLAGGADLRSNNYNVMMVGDSSVGKTSFMKRAQSGKFSLDIPASVGLDSCMWTVVVEGKPVVLQLWDTAGQERFHSITRQIFHKAHAFLLMYDITSSQSFSAVSYWANCIQEGAAESVTILLVGNKSDRAERQVKTQEAENLAKEHNFGFMECSAATGENVVQSLETVARMLRQNDDARDDAVVLHKEPQQKASGCC
ncbi:uncharacterized protein rab44 [Cebidichthys violaceus]|uniref:uncharacterized protein rab44 n=1 Tax=Cebidichthys violaceus TaxID=271503 RepID=UPI0035CAB50C